MKIKTIRQFGISALMTLVAGCGSDKEATSLNIPEMEPPVSKNSPSGLQLVSTDSSPKLPICANGGPDCPTVASVLKSRLFGTEGNSIVGLLNSADSRITEIESRTANSVVPCFENDGAAVTASFGSTHSVPMTLHCYDDLTDGNGQSNGLLMFGRDASETYYVADKSTGSDDNVRITLAVQDQSENVEVWSAGYDSENGNGGHLAHLKSTSADGVIEFTTAGSPLTGFGVDLVCGVQVKLNANYIYVSGQIGAPILANNDCSGIATSSFCLDTTNFESQDVSLCTSEGLTTFSLTPIVQSHVDNSVWKETVDLDYKAETQVFTTESIEDEGPL